MLPTVFADTARHIRRIGAVIEVVSAGCCQSGLWLDGELLASPGEPPDLVARQVQVAEHRPERLPRIDRIHELLA